MSYAFVTYELLSYFIFHASSTPTSYFGNNDRHLTLNLYQSLMIQQLDGPLQNVLKKWKCPWSLWDKEVWTCSFFLINQQSICCLSAAQYRAKIWCWADKISFLAYEQIVEWCLCSNESINVFLSDLKKLTWLFGEISKQGLTCTFVVCNQITSSSCCACSPGWKKWLSHLLGQ